MAMSSPSSLHWAHPGLLHGPTDTSMASKVGICPTSCSLGIASSVHRAGDHLGGCRSSHRILSSPPCESPHTGNASPSLWRSCCIALQMRKKISMRSLLVSAALERRRCANALSLITVPSSSLKYSFLKRFKVDTYSAMDIPGWRLKPRYASWFGLKSLVRAGTKGFVQQTKHSLEASGFPHL